MGHRMSLGSVQLYGCGGFGINTVRPWDTNLPANKEIAESEHSPVISVGYVDTSLTANLKGDEPADNVYVVNGLDGAGKIRRDSHKAFATDNAVNQILLKMEPKALNIVVFSLSGGSGNTIGTDLLMELIKRGERAFAIITGSGENALTVQNTLGSIKTLDYKARQSSVFVPVVFEDNGDNSERAIVDERVKAIIGAFCIMSGPKITELDTADILNWLRPDRVPGINIAPQLALIEVVTDAAKLSSIADPISVASIISDPTETLQGVLPDYSTVGYHPKDGRDRQSYHYVLSIEAIPAIAGMVKGKLEEIEKRRSARKTQASIVGENDVADDGMFY